MSRCLALSNALVLLFGCLSFLQARAPIEHPFPMTQGTYWLYRGTVRWTHDVNRSSETEITWRTEVRRILQLGNVSAAVISGFPSDLDWSDGRPKPCESLLVESAGKFYLLSGDRFQDALHRFEQPSGSLEGLLSDDDLILEWPLHHGQKYCDRDGMARSDGRYCWVVASAAPASLREVSGVPTGDRTEFVVEYKTNPDDKQLSFVPEIGLTKYAYHHHGTVADTELQLIEFHDASSDRKQLP